MSTASVDSPDTTGVRAKGAPGTLVGARSVRWLPPCGRSGQCTQPYPAHATCARSGLGLPSGGELGAVAWPSPRAGHGHSSEPSGAHRDEPWPARCALQATAPMVRFLLGASVPRAAQGSGLRRCEGSRWVLSEPPSTREFHYSAGRRLGAHLVRFGLADRPSAAGTRRLAKVPGWVESAQNGHSDGHAERWFEPLRRACQRPATHAVPRKKTPPRWLAFFAGLRPIRRAQIEEFCRSDVSLSVSAFGPVHVTIRA